jgi:uncharacterized Fe-S radical SAM superfamily protein PflX
LFVTSQLTITLPKNTPCSSNVEVVAVMYRDRVSYVHVHIAASTIARSRGSPGYRRQTATSSIRFRVHMMSHLRLVAANGSSCRDALRISHICYRALERCSLCCLKTRLSRALRHPGTCSTLCQRLPLVSTTCLFLTVESESHLHHLHL